MMKVASVCWLVAMVVGLALDFGVTWLIFTAVLSQAWAMADQVCTRLDARP